MQLLAMLGTENFFQLDDKLIRVNFFMLYTFDVFLLIRMTNRASGRKIISDKKSDKAPSFQRVLLSFVVLPEEAQFVPFLFLIFF